jgi:hypothetical protein
MLGATRMSVEAMKGNEKRIPGGVYHRFAEERASKLGAEQKVLSTIEPGGFFLYALAQFYISHE